MNELELLKKGGVVGGGGGGFPLWRKLSRPAQTLLINGAECEPLLNSDQYLMREYPQQLVEAALRIASIISAQEVIICLKDHYHQQIDALKGVLSQKPLSPPLRLHLLPTVYPIGDEQATVHSATGRTVPPGGLPGDVGCTVVSVSTALNALRALSGKPVISRFLTLAGEVKRPGVYLAPIGMPLSLLLEQAGGPTCADYRLQLGGPMMGGFSAHGSDPVVTKTLGGVIVLPKGHSLERFHELPLEQVRNRAKSACIQCRYCTDLCPRYLLGHPIYPHLTMRAYATGSKLEPSALLCMECGICELYACPMGINPRRVQQIHKAALRQQGEEHHFELGPAPSMAEYHQAPSERVAAKIDVLRYEFDTPSSAVPVSSPLVCIPLKQHIGAPAKVCVEAGSMVQAGEPIAKMPEGALGADIHASISGQVERVEEDLIVIRCHQSSKGDTQP